MSGTADDDSRCIKKMKKVRLKVLVSEVNQKMNVEKYAKSHGKTYKSREIGSEFEIIIE